MEVYLIELIKKENIKKSLKSAMIVFFYNILLPWGLIIIVTWSTNISDWFFLFYLFVSLFIGTRLRAVNNMSHECIHYSYCCNALANDAFGEIFAIIEFSKFKLIRKEHYTHHKFLGDINLDQDFHCLRRHGLQKKMTKKRLLSHIKKTLLLHQITDTFFFIIYDKDAPLWATFMRMAYILLLSILFFFFPLEFISFFIVPVCYFYQVQKHLTDIIDHDGLLHHKDAVNQSRNFIIKNKYISAFFMPRYDGYHLVHHLFP